jgi:hypothetical protein
MATSDGGSHDPKLSPRSLELMQHSKTKLKAASNPKLIMKDKSLNYISEGLQLCISHDVFLHIGGTHEDEFKLLSFIWMFKVI